MWVHMPYMDPMGYEHFGRSINCVRIYFIKNSWADYYLTVFLTCMEQLCLHACFSGAEDMEDV